ncbi:MAG: response regulator [Acidimicrobiales bacterium]
MPGPLTHPLPGGASPPAAGLRVMLVDDHVVFAETMAEALTAMGCTVVGLAHTAAEALELARRSPPDVALVDYRLPDDSGAGLILRLVAAAPDARVVVLTGSSDESTLLECIEAGCDAFVTKDQRLAEVFAAVQSAARGESVIPPALLAKVLPRVRRGGQGPRAGLTAREREILSAMAAGLSNQAIAERFFLSIHTVRNHVANVLAKLGAHSRLEAVASATREGIIPPGGAVPTP